MYLIWQYKFPRTEFPFEPASGSVCQSSSSSRVEASRLFIHAVVPPTNSHPLSPWSVMTAWRFYDRGAVALLWQQAGWPGYVLVKRTACQRDQDRVRTPPRRHPTAGHSTPSCSRLPTLRPFKHHPDPGNNQDFHIHHSHTHPSQPAPQPTIHP